MIFSNGDEYKGQWDKDLFHGLGKYGFNGDRGVLKGRF